MLQAPFVRSGWDVVISGLITVRQPDPKVYIWSSSLWYSKLSPDDEYRWREVSYFMTSLSGRKPPDEPYALDDDRMADEVASRTSSINAIAFGPVCIDDENIEEFKDRWIHLYSMAVNRNRGHPSHIPLGPDWHRW